ncbi:MAG: hypothetical protein Q9208_003351 [Pyrenodesmia sp. 3 TL-2023]
MLTSSLPVQLVSGAPVDVAGDVSGEASARSKGKVEQPPGIADPCIFPLLESITFWPISLPVQLVSGTTVDATGDVSGETSAKSKGKVEQPRGIAGPWIFPLPEFTTFWRTQSDEGAKSRLRQSRGLRVVSDDADDPQPTKAELSVPNHRMNSGLHLWLDILSELQLSLESIQEPAKRDKPSLKYRRREFNPDRWNQIQSASQKDLSPAEAIGHNDNKSLLSVDEKSVSPDDTDPRVRKGSNAAHEGVMAEALIPRASGDSENSPREGSGNPDPNRALCHMLTEYLLVLKTMKQNPAEGQRLSGHSGPSSPQAWTDDLSCAEIILHVAILTALETTLQAFLGLGQVYAIREARELEQELSEEVD